MEENTGTMIKLTSTNYTIWKPKMEDILYYKDMYDPLRVAIEEGDLDEESRVEGEPWFDEGFDQLLVSKVLLTKGVQAAGSVE
jgi:hypothetical protein